MPKKKQLSEKEVANTWLIVKGFNVPDGDGEKRFEPTKKGSYVTPNDFDEDVFAVLVRLGAIEPVEEPLKEDEVVILEKVDG